MTAKNEQMYANNKQICAMFELVQQKDATIRAKEKERQDLRRRLDQAERALSRVNIG